VQVLRLVELTHRTAANEVAHAPQQMRVVEGGSQAVCCLFDSLVPHLVRLGQETLPQGGVIRHKDLPPEQQQVICRGPPVQRRAGRDLRQEALGERAGSHLRLQLIVRRERRHGHGVNRQGLFIAAGQRISRRILLARPVLHRDVMAE